jgi:hypothetical protein
MMSREPLNSFAARIVRNNEVAEFIDALIELVSAVNKHRYTIVEDLKEKANEKI